MTTQNTLGSDKTMNAKKLLFTILRWIRRIIFVVLLLLLIPILFLLIREAIAREKYRAEYPPPGQMVSFERFQEQGTTSSLTSLKQLSMQFMMWLSVAKHQRHDTDAHTWVLDYLL